MVTSGRGGRGKNMQKEVEGKKTIHSEELVVGGEYEKGGGKWRMWGSFREEQKGYDMDHQRTNV